MGIRCADHVTPLYPQKLALTSPTGGGRPVGIVRSRTKATEIDPLSDQNPANSPHSQWSQSWFSLGNSCYHSVQKQQTFHRMCRNTLNTTYKSVFLLFCLVMKLSLEGIWEQSAGENILVCTDVTWAKTAQSCLWLCYRLDNPRLSFQQSQEIFLCHKMSKQALGPMQCMLGIVSMCIIQRGGDETKNTPPPTAQIKNEWSYITIQISRNLTRLRVPTNHALDSHMALL